MAHEDIEQDPALAKIEVGRSIEQLHGVIRDIRSYIFDLRPRQFTGDLHQALTDLGREFQENSSILTQVRAPAGLPAIDHDVGVALYVIVHEALSNTRKYADASKVLISLSQHDGAICLDVQDDGRGFDSAQEVAEGHRGLRNMASRARIIGAELDIESAPGRGTAIRVKVYLP
jgi:signal transduction histidine kinase